MKQPKNYIILSLSLLLLAALAALSWEILRADQLQDLADAANAKLDHQAAEQAALAKRLRQAEGQAKMLQNALKNAVAAIAAGKPAKGPAARRTALTLDQMQQWLADANDPATAQRLYAEARALTQKHYSGLFAQLHLTPAQTEALTKLLTDKRLTPSDVAVASVERGIDPVADAAAYNSEVAKARAGIDAQVESILGPDGFAQFHSYDLNTAVTGSMNLALGALNSASNPLTPNQAAHLTQALQATGTGRLSAKVISDAQAYLSPVQTQALMQAFSAQSASQQKQRLAQLPGSPGGN